MSDEQTPEDSSTENEEGSTEPEETSAGETSEEVTDEPEEGASGEPAEEGPAEAEEIAAEDAGLSSSPDETREDVARRSPVGIIVTVIGILVIVAIGIWVAMGVLRPDAPELLKESLAKYRNADQLHVESTVTIKRSMGDQNDEVSLPTTVWVSRPNKLLFESGPESQRTRVVSDGESLYVEPGMLPGVIKLPAPQSIEEMPLDNLSMAGALGIPNMAIPDVASILAGAFEVTQGTVVNYEINPEDEWLSSLEQPEGTWTLTLEPETGPPIAVWIDKSNRLIRKYAAAVDYDTMLEADPTLEQRLEGASEENRQMIKQMTRSLVADVTTAEVGAAPPEDAFAYQPPEGANVVEAQTIQEGAQKLLQSMGGMPGMPGGPPPAPEGEPPADEGANSDGGTAPDSPAEGE